MASRSEGSRPRRRRLAGRCAPHSFFSTCRKERTRRARWKKEKGARGLQSFEHRRPRGGKACCRCQWQKKAARFFRSGRKTRGSAQARSVFRAPQGDAYALALLRSMSIPPYFHSKRLSFPGESRGNPKGARKPRLVVSIRVGPGRGKGTSPPPVADEGLVPFPQRSKNARKSVSAQHFSLPRKVDRKRNLSTLPHLPFPGLLRDGPPMARLRKLRPCFSCHRQRKAAIPLPGVVFIGTFLLDKQKKGTPPSRVGSFVSLFFKMTSPEPENSETVLDKWRKPAIIGSTIEHLIKSGGGNGPVKPGNLRRLKVPNPAVRRKMRLKRQF